MWAEAKATSLTIGRSSAKKAAKWHITMNSLGTEERWSIQATL